MDLTIERRYAVEVPREGPVHLLLVGCGGTGSFLALHLARLAYHVRERYGRQVQLTFVDPDLVEPKNIGRQNFVPAEVGQPKALTLMARCNRAFGLASTAHVAPFTAGLLPDGRLLPGGSPALRLVIGAVDNAAARRDIHRAVAAQSGWVWYLDCGNHQHSGQVLLGNRTDLTQPEISPLGFCAGLPLPGIQHPELLMPEPVTAPAASSRDRSSRPERGPSSSALPKIKGHWTSCADLALADVQGLMVNQAVVAFAAQYVYRLVVSHDLDVFATYFDLAAGSARSRGIQADTEEEPCGSSI